MNSIEDRILLHNAYWNREYLKFPIVSFRIGDYFFSSQFKAARSLLVNGKEIKPDMINVDSFLEDYERMYQEVTSTGQDAFWTAEPFTGIPWMEAIIGCEIYGTENSFISHPCAKSMQDLDKIKFDQENPWFKKYMEFVEKLHKLSEGRFPIGQPITRGSSDMLGAVIGQSQLVYAMFEEPEKMKEAFYKVTDVFLNVIRSQYNAISDFQGGYSMGFYHLWSPGKCIWFQEDLSAILSPSYYNDFLKGPNEKICEGYDYTSVHLHPASFFILDKLMKIERLKVIEVNKDVGGPKIKQMIPVFQRILSKKNLIIWGDLDHEDIDCIMYELPHKGVFLNIVSETVEKARDLMEYIKLWK
ncbi:MAG TPA: hypothetical protein VIK78_22190 [Ruminiclostridium sp.]